MTLTPDELATRLRAAGILPVLRCASGAEMVDQALVLRRSGISLIELTASTPGWIEALTELRASLPQACLGVGTVTSAERAAAAVGAGADFLVSPYACPPARAQAETASVPMIEGGFTPREIAAAAAHGPAKLFPAAAVGPSFLSALLRVLPQALIVPTGGVALADVQAWLDAGALSVGVGAGLFADGSLSAGVLELAGAGR